MKRLFFVLSSLWNKPTARLAAGFLFCVLTLGLFAPVLPLADPSAIDLGNKFISPCSAHWLGTDALGRDIFSRLIWGIRSSVYTALVATLLTALFGTLWGLVSAAANRQTDELMMRFCDLWMSFPSEVMILAMVGLLGPGIENIIIGCLVAKWPWYARMIRSLAKRIQNSAFIRFSLVNNADRRWILTRHLFPNILADFFVLATLDTGSVILMISSLSFLGLGVSAPTTEWGMMLAEAKNVMTLYPWQMLPAGLMILCTVVALHFLGDALAQVFEPKQRASSHGGFYER